jgi:hypothetical protein
MARSGPVALTIQSRGTAIGYAAVCPLISGVRPKGNSIPVPTDPYSPPGNRKSKISIVKTLALLAAGILTAFIGFVVGAKYHESASDEVRNLLGVNAIHSLRRQAILIHSCETGQLTCDAQVQLRLWDTYAMSLFDVWALYLATNNVDAADGMCTSLRLIRAKDGLARVAQGLANDRLDCAFRGQKPKPETAVRAEEEALGRPAPTLDPALSKAQQVEEIRRRIESKRARMRSEAEAARSKD